MSQEPLSDPLKSWNLCTHARAKAVVKSGKKKRPAPVRSFAEPVFHLRAVSKEHVITSPEYESSRTTIAMRYQ